MLSLNKKTCNTDRKKILPLEPKSGLDASISTIRVKKCVSSSDNGSILPNSQRLTRICFFALLDPLLMSTDSNPQVSKTK